MIERFKTFTLLIAKINRNIRKIKTEEMAEYNLKSPHVSCLYYLYKAEGESLTAKELSDICDEDKAALSRSIDYLEKNGLIACDSKEKKRYKAGLSLTEKGREVAKSIDTTINGVLDFLGTAMTEEERVRFYRNLEAINNNLENFCQKYNN